MASNSRKNRKKRKRGMVLKKGAFNLVGKEVSERTVGFNIFGSRLGKALERFDKEESHVIARNKTYAVMKNGGKTPEELSDLYHNIKTQHTNRNGLLKGGFLSKIFSKRNKG